MYKSYLRGGSLIHVVCWFFSFSGLSACSKQQNSDSSERLVGLSDDVGAGFISGHSSQPATASDLNVERSADVVPPDEIGNLAVSKVIRVDQKRFFFDLGSNNRGHFLRISEVMLVLMMSIYYLEDASQL